MKLHPVTASILPKTPTASSRCKDLHNNIAFATQSAVTDLTNFFMSLFAGVFAFEAAASKPKTPANNDLKTRTQTLMTNPSRGA